LDVSEPALELLRSTGLPARAIRNRDLPPAPRLEGQRFRLIYAYSVFSHLPERAAALWLDELGAHLADGGNLVVTTRGETFLDCLDEWKGEPPNDDYLRAISDATRDCDVRRSYRNGSFVYLDTGLGEHYGEALIPEEYARRAAPDRLKLAGFLEGVPDIDQTIIVYTAS
jgi:hypothetical protein